MSWGSVFRLLLFSSSFVYNRSRIVQFTRTVCVIHYSFKSMKLGWKKENRPSEHIVQFSYKEKIEYRQKTNKNWWYDEKKEPTMKKRCNTRFFSITFNVFGSMIFSALVFHTFTIKEHFLSLPIKCSLCKLSKIRMRRKV